MKGNIYTLECESGVVFYVGCTSLGMDERMIGHRANIKKAKSPVYKYMKDNGISPVMKLVEEIECKYKNELYDAEEFWIEQFRQWGFCLKNN